MTLNVLIIIYEKFKKKQAGEVNHNWSLSLKIPHAPVMQASLSQPIRCASLNDLFRTGRRNAFDAVMRCLDRSNFKSFEMYLNSERI